MTLREMRAWEVYPHRSTVSNDATRAADAKDAKFQEVWTDKRMFGWIHPNIKPKGVKDGDQNLSKGRTYRQRNPTRRQRELAAK